MKQIDRKPVSLVCGGLLALSVLAASVAAGCGRVKADGTGSETHWLSRCDSDLECEEGSCECGVCSLPCDDAPPECAELGIAGVQCTGEPSACDDGSSAQGGAAPAASGGVCLLPCTSDADCSELGSGASCRGQRCERPTTSIDTSTGGTGGQSGGASGGTGATGGTASGGQGGSMDQELEIATLCDGSEDVRLAYVVAGGFVSGYYEFLSSVYGHSSFAIDGQCRFWQTKVSNGWVYSGVLDVGRAQEFARSIGYGHLSDYSSFEDPACPDGTGSTLAAPEGRIRCACNCGANPDAAAGWRAAFRAVSTDALEALFSSAETVTGPARLVLLTPAGTNTSFGPETWPLERAPADNEILFSENLFTIPPSSGVLIEDAGELAALRAMRADVNVSRQPGSIVAFIPVVWTDPSEGEQRFDLFMRDEVPEKVRAALEAAGQ